MNPVKLTAKQSLFVEVYAANGGNALDAAREAGYKKPSPQGYENMQKPAIIAAIKELTAQSLSKIIATREQRQAFWTKIMDDTNSEMKDRLRASELLGKSHGDFIDRVDSTTRIVVEHVHETING